jgi:ubiquinone/menaquinone biosynthesis C-methylase UbiE
MSEFSVKDHYLDNSVAQDYDRERFSGVIGRTFHRLERRTLVSVVGLVTKEVPQPRVLDIPCGTGRITELLLEQGLTVTGGDISPAMIQVAREKLARFGSRASWRQLDLDRLDLEDNSFDLVTCIRLLHHLHTDARARVLREIARVTRRFVLINVSFSSPVYRLRRRVKRALGQGVSTASSTWAEIERETAAAGLRVQEHRMVWPLLSEDLVLLLRKG